MKKLLTVLVCLLVLPIALGLTFSNEIPTDLSSIVGNDTFFSIDVNETTISGVVVFNGTVLLPALNCSSMTCSGTYSLINWTEDNYDFYYQVNGDNSLIYSVTINKTIPDVIPPIAPTITPPSGSVFSIQNPSINIDYSLGAENVTMKVYSGLVLLSTFSGSDNYTMNQAFPNGTWSLTFNASDVNGNVRSTPYVVNINTNNNITLTVSNLLGSNNNYFPVKSNIQRSVSDYWTLGFNNTLSGGTSIRMQMTDIISALDTIQVNEDTQPILFCDLDPINLNWTGTGPSYLVDNLYDEVNQSAIACPDTNPSSLVEFPVYLMIPTPAGLTGDDYTTDIDLGMY